MAKLGEVCKLNMGQSPDSSSYNDTGDGIPFFKGNADFGEVHPNIRVWCNAPTKIAHPGEILISVRAPIGAMNIADCECCIGRGLASISADEAVCTTKYLWYGISSKIEELNAKGTGSTFKAVNKKTLEETEIPIRDLMEQERIAAKLDSVAALITLRKRQVKKLDELVKARFVEMFGELHKTKYNIKTLDELCEFIKDGTHQTPTYVDVTEGYKFLSSKDVTSGYIDWSSIKYISEELHQELYKRIAPQRGDILLAKNGTTGIPAIVETDETFDIYVSLALLRLKPNNNVRYIWSALRMPETKAQFDNSLKGVGVPNLHLGEIKKTKIIVPPLSLQNQFSTFVERVDQQKQTVQQSLEKLELMKKALMQEYFG